jgi:putative membrane protein
MRLILRWIVNTAALAVTIYILHVLGLAKWTGGKGVGGAVTALLAVLIMAIVNALIRPIVTMLTLPLSCATFGLFAFVINAVMFWLVGELSGAFAFSSTILGPLVGSILMSFVSGAMSHLVVSPRET